MIRVFKLQVSLYLHTREGACHGGGMRALCIQHKSCQFLFCLGFPWCRMKDTDRTCSVVLMWTWWNERNRIREGGRPRPAGEVAWMIKHQTSNFLNFLNLPDSNSGVAMPKRPRWKPPDGDFIKVNTDGTFSAKFGTGGWGAVFCDRSGEALFTAAGYLNNLQNALHAETKAALEAIHVAIQLGMSNVILETDALVLKQSLDDKSFDLSSLSVIFESIKALIRDHFMNFNILFFPRTCNVVAHSLAAMGCKMHNERPVLCNGPVPDVMSLGESDLALATN